MSAAWGDRQHSSSFFKPSWTHDWKAGISLAPTSDYLHGLQGVSLGFVCSWAAGFKWTKVFQTCSDINLYRLCQCELPSFWDICCRGVCFLSDIMELDDTLLVTHHKNKCLFQETMTEHQDIARCCEWFHAGTTFCLYHCAQRWMHPVAKRLIDWAN